MRLCCIWLYVCVHFCFMILYVVRNDEIKLFNHSFIIEGSLRVNVSNEVSTILHVNSTACEIDDENQFNPIVCVYRNTFSQHIRACYFQLIIGKSRVMRCMNPLQRPRSNHWRWRQNDKVWHECDGDSTDFFAFTCFERCEYLNNLVHALPQIRIRDYSWADVPIKSTHDCVTCENMIRRTCYRIPLFTASHLLFHV